MEQIKITPDSKEPYFEVIIARAGPRLDTMVLRNNTKQLLNMPTNMTPMGLCALLITLTDRGESPMAEPLPITSEDYQPDYCLRLKVLDYGEEPITMLALRWLVAEKSSLDVPPFPDVLIELVSAFAQHPAPNQEMPEGPFHIVITEEANDT